MTYNNSSLPPVDTTVFTISPLKINFKFKSLQSGKITLDESGVLRSVSKFYLKREQNSKIVIMRLPAQKVEDSTSKDTFSFRSDSIRNFEFVDTSHVKTSTTVETRALNIQGNKIVKTQSNWMIAVSMFTLILMAVIRFSFGKYLSRLIDSILNYQISNNLFLEKNMRNLRGSIFLNLLFFVNAALFAVQYYQHFVLLNQDTAHFLIFLYTLIGIFVLYLAKIIIIRSIGYIFNGVKEGKEYLHSVFIYNKNLGIFLLPITLSVPFIADFAAPVLLQVGLFVAFLFYLFRLVRGIKILFRKHVSIFYMILYLCALEILPLLVIYKLLNSLA